MSSAFRRPSFTVSWWHSSFASRGPPLRGHPDKTPGTRLTRASPLRRSTLCPGTLSVASHGNGVQPMRPGAAFVWSMISRPSVCERRSSNTPPSQRTSVAGPERRSGRSADGWPPTAKPNSVRSTRHLGRTGWLRRPAYGGKRDPNESMRLAADSSPELAPQSGSTGSLDLYWDDQ